MSHNTSNVIADTLGINFNTTISNCRKYKGFYPNLTPYISFLSQYEAKQNEYTNILLNGYNFLPYGTTTLKFGSLIDIPIVYLSSFNLSFAVPYGLNKGKYSIQLFTKSTTQLLPVDLASNIVEFVII